MSNLAYESYSTNTSVRVPLMVNRTIDLAYSVRPLDAVDILVGAHHFCDIESAYDIHIKSH